MRVSGPNLPLILGAGCGVLVLIGAIVVTLWYVASIATVRPAAKPKTAATATATATATPKTAPVTKPLVVPGKR